MQVGGAAFNVNRLAKEIKRDVIDQH